MATNHAFNLVKKTLRHMEHISEGHQVGGILLAGDPGIGKTTFISMLGSLLGLKTIVIEVPHITEEHLINIPFMVFNPVTNSSATMTDKVSTQPSEYKMVLAQSNLFTQMTTGTMMNDEAYLQHIQKAPKHVQEMFTALGGNATTIPPLIEQARGRHKTILFLDEFYRQTSMRIRNILRGILNGNVGMHKIPRDVYIMYASNMKDQGLDQIPSNHQFNVVEHKAPQSGDWFNWLVSTYEKHSHIKLNHQVIDKFKALLTDEDISFTDADSDVRTSPRRWEQILLYINTSLPVKDLEDARALITNVKNSFIHYKTEQHSSLSVKVVKAVTELIKDTSDISIDENNTLDGTEWRKSLLHYIQQQKAGGSSRKHIPVVSGLPGIGKTTAAASVAASEDLRLIEIDVGEIYAEDAIGMPLPGQRNGDNITVNFSMPKLYQQIMGLIKKRDDAYIELLKHEYGAKAPQHIKAYEKQEWKYLIFFDELNRVDEKTFNSLRKVILEKNFGPSGNGDGGTLALPKQAIVVAAINPEGVGTSDLTDHFRDVIDIIPAKGSWADTREWLSKKKFKNTSAEMLTTAMTIIDSFIKKFSTKEASVPKQQRPFQLVISGTDLYISPREYADMYSTLVREIKAGVGEVSDREDDIRTPMNEAVGDALEDSLNMIFYKSESGIEKDEFMHALKIWVANLPDSMFAELLSRQATGGMSSGNALAPYLEGRDLTSMPNDNHIINAHNLSNHAQIIDELKILLNDKLIDDKTITKYMIKRDQPKIVVSGESLKVDNSQNASLVENFFLALLGALHLHDFVHDRIAIVGSALNIALSDVRKNLVKKGVLSEDVSDELTDAAVEIRADMAQMIADLKK